MPSVYDILDDVKRPYSKEYERKQVHHVPEFEVVPNRPKWLVERVAGKVVLDIGCASGDLHTQLGASASQIVGIDREPCDHPTAAVYDLDDVRCEREIPFAALPIETIVCGEVIEHLSNPGQALTRLGEQWPGAELLITVPNAFGESGRRFIQAGIENVNLDHVAWYSWHTMCVLLGRAGWDAKEIYWYNGKPRVSEGIIFVCRTMP